MDSSSKFACGPKLNYGFSLGGKWEVGATMDYLIAFSDPHLSALGIIGNLSYRFF